MVLLRFPTAALAVISSLLLSPAARAASLESVLADQTNVTMFRGLVKVGHRQSIRLTQGLVSLVFA